MSDITDATDELVETLDDVEDEIKPKPKGNGKGKAKPKSAAEQAQQQYDEFMKSMQEFVATPEGQAFIAAKAADLAIQAEDAKGEASGFRICRIHWGGSFKKEPVRKQSKDDNGGTVPAIMPLHYTDVDAKHYAMYKRKMDVQFTANKQATQRIRFIERLELIK